MESFNKCEKLNAHRIPRVEVPAVTDARARAGGAWVLIKWYKSKKPCFLSGAGLENVAFGYFLACCSPSGHRTLVIREYATAGLLEKVFETTSRNA